MGIWFDEPVQAGGLYHAAEIALMNRDRSLQEPEWGKGLEIFRNLI
jgi:hypothetical protein